MLEKNFQSLFKGWVAINRPAKTTVWELKLVKNGRLEFDRVYDHQVAGLLGAKRSGQYHKIADQPAAFIEGRRMHFGGKKPFDCQFIRDADAFVVVLFYKPGESKIMYFIDVDAWVQEKESSKRRSLDEKRAREISHMIKAL